MFVGADRVLAGLPRGVASGGAGGVAAALPEQPAWAQDDGAPGRPIP